MTVCKATFSGTVFRAPEKRFTQTNIPITFLTLQIDGNDDLLIRVISMGKTAEMVERNVSKNDRIIVEGRLKTGAVKDEDGNEKRIMELELSSFEKIRKVFSKTPLKKIRCPDTRKWFCWYPGSQRSGPCRPRSSAADARCRP